MSLQTPFIPALRVQLAQALVGRASQRQKGEDARGIDAIITSILNTLTEVHRATEKSRDLSQEGFVLRTNSSGEMEVRVDGRPVRGTGSIISRLPDEPGVRLLKGQVILMSDGWVKFILEEALSRNGTELNRLQNDKKGLQAAWLRMVEGTTSKKKSALVPPNGRSMAA